MPIRKIALLLIIAFGHIQAAEEPKPVKLNKEAAEILRKGIRTNDDFKKYLVAVGGWTLEYVGSPANNTLTFRADGTCIDLLNVAKFAIVDTHKLKTRLANGKPGSEYVFANDYMSYTGVWNKSVPFNGKAIPPPQ